MYGLAVILFAIFAVISANPIYLVQDEDGQQFVLTPVLQNNEEIVESRQRRQAQLFGGGAANGKQQGGTVGINNPNGSGGSVQYGHANGYGHNIGLEGRVPIWSSKNKFGESTLNAAGSVGQHYGGPGGKQHLGHGVGLNFNHRF